MLRFEGPEAARRLGVSRFALIRLMAKHDVKRK
jgi:hypothetical protein